MAGNTIYNVLALADVELSATQPDRPVYPPKLICADVVFNPFTDIVPRITRAERKAQASARNHAAQRQTANERDKVKKKKNTALLSFGDEEETTEGAGRRPMSSHDLLNDHRLSKSAYHKSHSNDLPTTPATSTTNSDTQPLPEVPLGAEKKEQPPMRDLREDLTRGSTDAPQDTKASVKPSHGQHLLASLVKQYRKDKPIEKRESQTLSKLETFRQNIRSKEPERKRPKIYGDTSTWGDEENMREYGASDDDDDVNWRFHRFDSGGVPLTGSADKYSIFDYEVTDSRDTKSDMATSLGFGGTTAVQDRAERNRRERIRSEGRRGRDWT